VDEKDQERVLQEDGSSETQSHTALLVKTIKTLDKTMYISLPKGHLNTPNYLLNNFKISLADSLS
jgi:hypothetical protein